MISQPSIVEEYHRMNSPDRATFRRWLTLNTVIAAIAVTLIAMIAINGVFWGGEWKSANSPKYNNEASQRIEAK